MTMSLLLYKRVHPATSRNLNIRLQVTMETLKQWVCMFLSKHFGCRGHMHGYSPTTKAVCVLDKEYTLPNFLCHCMWDTVYL